MFETAKGILNFLIADMGRWKNRCEDGSVLSWKPITYTVLYERISSTIDKLSSALEILESTEVPEEFLIGTPSRRKIRFVGSRKALVRRHYLNECLGILEALVKNRWVSRYTEFIGEIKKALSVLYTVEFPSAWRVKK